MSQLVPLAMGLLGGRSHFCSWKGWSAALILGVLIPMSQPPVHIVPVLFVSFTGLVWLVDGRKLWRSAFSVGWLLWRRLFCLWSVLGVRGVA